MILSGETIRMLLSGPIGARVPVLEPFSERTRVDVAGPEGRYLSLSYGLSMAGYDVRLDQDVRLGPAFSHESFSLASTLERFNMPNDVLAIVHDKSTWARLGLSVFNTAIEPGWRGYLTMELSNRGPYTLSIPRGTPIAQVVFHRVDRATDGYGDGKYQDQARGPVEAR